MPARTLITYCACVQMLLSVPAGLLSSALLNGALNLQAWHNSDRFRTVFAVDAVLAALTVPLSLLLRHAPERPPCASAETPYPSDGSAVGPPGDVSPTSSRTTSHQVRAYSPAYSSSTAMSGGGAPKQLVVAQRGERGQGGARRGLFRDTARLLRTWPFLLLLLAFSLTLGALNTYWLNMQARPSCRWLAKRRRVLTLCRLASRRLRLLLRRWHGSLACWLLQFQASCEPAYVLPPRRPLAFCTLWMQACSNTVAVQEYLDRQPAATGVHVGKLFGSLGAIAFTAGAPAHRIAARKEKHSRQIDTCMQRCACCCISAAAALATTASALATNAAALATTANKTFCSAVLLKPSSGF